MAVKDTYQTCGPISFSLFKLAKPKVEEEDLILAQQRPLNLEPSGEVRLPELLIICKGTFLWSLLCVSFCTSNESSSSLMESAAQSEIFSAVSIVPGNFPPKFYLFQHSIKLLIHATYWLLSSRALFLLFLTSFFPFPSLPLPPPLHRTVNFISAMGIRTWVTSKPLPKPAGMLTSLIMLSSNVVSYSEESISQHSFLSFGY